MQTTTALYQSILAGKHMKEIKVDVYNSAGTSLVRSFANSEIKLCNVTHRTPAMSRVVTTLDKLDHCRKVRERGSLVVGLNPASRERYLALCAALAVQPVSVTYSSRQMAQDVTESMTIDDLSAQYMSRCLAYGKTWDRPSPVTFTQL